MEPSTSTIIDDVSDLEDVRSSLRLRVRQGSRMTRFGSLTPSPVEDAVTYPSDVTHGFFAKVYVSLYTQKHSVNVSR